MFRVMLFHHKLKCLAPFVTTYLLWSYFTKVDSGVMVTDVSSTSHTRVV